jgi:gliding motility-associated-like protein
LVSAKFKMRQYLFRCVFLLVAVMQLQSTIVAQNLVPNPSFENFTACPTFASQLNLAAPWHNPTLGTPEYFNACANFADWISVPAQPTGGYQLANTGNAYAGIFTYRSDVAQMREYLEVELTEALQAGQCYYFEMFVNMPNDQRFATDGIGACVKVGNTNVNSVFVLPLSAQIKNEPGNVLSDTVSWTKFSGYFTASGGEDHLVIGNFNTDENTVVVDLNPGAWYNSSSYLLIDDVSIVPSTISLNLGNDTTYCTVSELTLDASQPDATYSWQDGSTSATYTVNQSGTYDVTVRRGGCSASDEVTLQMLSFPQTHLNDTLICKNDVAEIELRGVKGSYLWSTGSTEPKIEVQSSGEYSVQITNACGTANDTMYVEAYECACDVYLPAAFSPNRDHLNDDYFIGIDCPKLIDFEFLVFSRNGELVYATNDPLIRWDGTVSGVECPSGVYAYTVKYYSLKAGQIAQQDYSGKLTLIR